MQNHFNIRLAKILQADMVFFICVVLHNRYFFMRKEKRKTSLKGYSASKCDIFIIGYFQNILGFFGQFLGNFLGILWKQFGNSLWKSLGIVNDCLHLGILCRLVWEFSMIVYIFKSQSTPLVSYIFKVSCLFTSSKSADCLHSKSYLKMEGTDLFVKILVFVKIFSRGRRRKDKKFRSLEVREVSSLHLKMQQVYLVFKSNLRKRKIP